MNRYGLPYMGSKNKIAEWIMSYLPDADNFYDLFCGGCAITHCAMVTKPYKDFYINDINGEMPNAFIDCIKGKYLNDKRWISHEEFDALKGKGDMLVDLCFSFGNNWRKGYAYSREIEPFKRALHHAIVLHDYEPMIKEYGVDLSALDNVELNAKDRYLVARELVPQRFQMQHLESLERLQSLERLHISAKSYDEIEVKPNSVIYCDIPYRNTATYNENDFDYDAFYDWCLRQSSPVFISEYDMPPSDFVCIAALSKTCQLCATNNALQSVERLFIPKHQEELSKPLTLF